MHRPALTPNDTTHVRPGSSGPGPCATAAKTTFGTKSSRTYTTSVLPTPCMETRSCIQTRRWTYPVHEPLPLITHTHTCTPTQRVSSTHTHNTHTYKSTWKQAYQAEQPESIGAYSAGTLPSPVHHSLQSAMSHESCCTYWWVMSHMRKSHITHTNESCRTYSAVEAGTLHRAVLQFLDSISK